MIIYSRVCDTVKNHAEHSGSIGEQQNLKSSVREADSGDFYPLSSYHIILE